ncbi:MAG: fibronectin type III domain-containing protein [Bacteroidetes bacterium]|nr:fibronectin type III domain-containing protein [Bacteroidota bacterium]
MKKIFYTLFVLSTIFLIPKIATSQSVLDPSDPIVTYDPGNPPVQPAWGQIGKWVRTKRLSWNTDSYKAYIYKGCAFRLKFPKTYDPNANDGKKYPMMVFFHGLGETGTIYDNEYQLYHGGDDFAAAVDNGTFDGYILCMQSQGFWGSGQYQYITEIINYMVTNNKLDLFRISDNGLSAGGQATWEMMFGHPNYIASCLPMSGVSIGYKDASNVNEAKFTPIWLFQGGLDGSPAPSTAQQVRDAFLAAGGDFTYTEYPDLGHGVWDRVWQEPEFYPYMLRAYSSNPWPLTGRTEFCPGDPINVTLGVPPGFDEYQWRKNDTIINGATTNSINVTNVGTYDARVRNGSIWSDWSHTPVIIKTKTPTIPPEITVEGLSSPVIPAPDGSTSVNLMVPNSYTSYLWEKVGNSNTLGTNNDINISQPGDYVVSVTEQYGCSSVFSNPFTVVNANGTNGPEAASSLTAVTLSNTKIELDWADKPNPAFNETAYEIYRSTTPGNSYAFIGKVPTDNITYVDSTALPNTTYYYVVRAVNNNAAAPLSNEASATTLTDKEPPAAPGNLHIVSTTSTSITIAWDSATDNVGVDRYDIYVNGVKTYSTDKTSIAINGLDNGSQYVFYVKSKDISGNYSTPSNQVSGFAALQGLNYKYYEGSWSVLPDFNTLTPVKTGITPNFDISVRNRDDQFGFVWQGYIKVPVAGTYTFETYSDDGSKLWLAPYDANATPLVNNDGLHGVQYKGGTVTLQPGIYPISAAFFEQGGDQVMQVYWTCSALFGDNNRHLITDNYLTDNYSTAGTVPVAPGNIEATALDYTRINVSWTDNSSDETGFEVYRADNSNGPFQIIATTPANTTAYIDSALSPLTTYYYTVKAINNSGSSFSGGLKYSYYTGTWNNLPDFNSLTPTSTGFVKNLDLSVASSTTNYALKFEGNITIPADGQYTFYTTSDDGSKLYIGAFDEGHLVVNNDYLQSPTERSGTINLTKGVYPIYITYFQQAGGYVLSAAYEGPGISKIQIPDSAFAEPSDSATTDSLPAAPLAVTQLKAIVQSASAINLTWKDNAINETAYKVYRSIGDINNFKFCAALPANSTSYNDTALFAHTIYYYKVYTIGIGNQQTPSAIVQKKTKDNFPVFNDIENRSVRYGITTSIPVTAFDADNDSLVYSIRNKPPFAKLINNGNNTATLTFKPNASKQGTYNNIQIIVNDKFGGKDTTSFTITVNDNYDPTIDSIADYTLTENDLLTINLNGHDQNATDSLQWTVTGAPNVNNLVAIDKQNAQLTLHPNYGAAGQYLVNVKVIDGKGGSTSRTFNVTVNDKDPNKTIYARFKNVDDIGTPWNNITGVTSNSLKDANGNVTNVGLNLQTSWFATSNGGPVTGNNSGVYPDAVLKNYYYFGIFGGPENVDAQVTGLDTALTYSFTFLAASSWPGAQDNGTTIFSSENQSASLYVQGNTQNTVTLSGLKADSTGKITFNMAKAADGTPVGYINALVINSVLDDGTTPLTPAALIAEGTGSGVQLHWNDISYNETNFQVYRSNMPNSGFVLINTLASNTTSYLDSSAKGNTQYYYKVLASNSYGNSGYSNVASVLTEDKIPVLNAISNVIMKNNTQINIPVIANDDVTDHVTLTASQMPSFVTFTDNGDGTGSFSVQPSAGTTGFYPGITVTARDNSDSVSTSSFNITVTDNVTSVYLNFSDGSLADKPWNNLTGWPFAGTTYSNMKDADNNVTGISVTLVDGFQGVVASGMRPGNNKGIYPDVVMRTAEFESSTNAKTIRVSGLSTSKKYSFIFFNSHDDGLNGTTNFTINGQTVTLNATYNINKTVQINGITPDGNGQVNIAVTKASGADYAYVSSIIIQAYDNNVSLINPSNLIVTGNTRNSVSLQWADKSFDETGFQVWRADSSNGSYNLINTVATNTTTYTDAGLTQNKTYYYVVRAVNGNGNSDFSNVAVAYTLAYAVYVNFTQDSMAPAPWYNTAVPPQKGYEWDNFMDEANNPTGISLTELNSFAGLYTDGNVTGNNSGVFPDAVISQSYGLFPGQTAYLKLSGLNMNMNYDFTFFASSRAYGDVNVAYTVNGKTVMLNTSLNTKGTVSVYGIRADENGEINITVAPGTSTSQFGLIGAMIVKAYKDPVFTLPSQLPQSFSNAIASTESIKNTSMMQKAKPKANFEYVVAYPNPFISNFTVSFNLLKKDNVNVEVFDVNGKLVYQNRFENLFEGNNVINVMTSNNLPSGIYIIKLTSLKTKTDKVIKLLKQQ